MELNIRAYIGKYSNVHAVMKEINYTEPFWELHGVTILEIQGETQGCSQDSDIFFSVYSETKINDRIAQNHNCKPIDRQLSPTEIKGIERAAAINAIRLCICDMNYEMFGDILLNKHPNCRNQHSAEKAIMEAAIKEKEKYIIKGD